MSLKLAIFGKTGSKYQLLVF